MTPGESWAATFSPCEKYRYTLIRRWSDLPLLNFLMLNPSTADAESNDPTVERCYRRAKCNPDFGGLVVTNIFAFRSTDPKQLLKQEDPIGPGNDSAIQVNALSAGMVVCGWGQHGSLRGRANAVIELLLGVDLYALKVNKNGQPAHPLYQSYQLEPTLWKEKKAVPT